ncbi:MAG: BLUF domain-containing protein [Erythrobacter sp.]|nr:BLUF domain-containing protein [Erythrobacter sp.]
MIGAETADAVVARILKGSAVNNAALGVTGALVMGRGRFAQFLEGSEESILHLKGRISVDRRHAQATTIEFGGGYQARQFADWSLAYAGPSNFFAQILGRVQLGQSQQKPSVRDDILMVFSEFAATPQPGSEAPTPAKGAHRTPRASDEARELRN